MSSAARIKERCAEFEAQQERDIRERARLEARSMREKIEDARDVTDVRAILHEMAEKLGMD